MPTTIDSASSATLAELNGHTEDAYPLVHDPAGTPADRKVPLLLSRQFHRYPWSSTAQTGASYILAAGELARFDASAQTISAYPPSAPVDGDRVGLLLTATASSYTLNVGGNTTDATCVGWWTMDEGAGATAADSSGGSHDGTLTNSPTWSTVTKAGLYFPDAACLKFAGGTDYVSVASSAGLALSGAMSASCWIYPTALPGSACSLIDHNPGSSSCAYRVQLTSAGKITVAWGGTIRLTSSATIATSAWTHVCVVRSGSAGNWAVSLSLGGLLDSSASGISSDPPSTTAAIALGGTGTNGQALTGRLDEVRLWSRALAAPEVLHLGSGYKATTPVDAATWDRVLRRPGEYVELQFCATDYIWRPVAMSRQWVHGWCVATKTADYTMQPWDYVLADCSGGSVNCVLPAAPVDGDQVAIGLRALASGKKCRVQPSAGQSMWGQSGYDATFAQASSQYASKSSPSGLPTGSSDRTIALWWKVTPGGSYSSYPIAFYYGTAATGQCFSVGIDPSSNLFVSAYASPQFSLSVSGLTSGWRFIVLKLSSSTLTTYVDNAQVDSRSFSVNTGTGSVNIAAFNGGQYFPGEIQDVRVYASAISDANRTLLWNGGAGTALAVGSPVAWWRCNEGTGSTLADSIGSNDLTVQSYSSAVWANPGLIASTYQYGLTTPSSVSNPGQLLRLLYVAATQDWVPN